MGKKGNHRDQSQEMLILRHAVENTNEAFVTIDENHVVLFFNKAAEKIFGYSRKEVIGHDLNIIMSPQKILFHSCHYTPKCYLSHDAIPTLVIHPISRLTIGSLL